MLYVFCTDNIMVIEVASTNSEVGFLTGSRMNCFKYFSAGLITDPFACIFLLFIESRLMKLLPAREFGNRTRNFSLTFVIITLRTRPIGGYVCISSVGQMTR